jgi:hypothetical protein
LPKELTKYNDLSPKKGSMPLSTLQKAVIRGRIDAGSSTPTPTSIAEVQAEGKSLLTTVL